MKNSTPKGFHNIQCFNLLYSFLGWTGQWSSSSCFCQSAYWNTGCKQSEPVFHNAQLSRLYSGICPSGSNYFWQYEFDQPSKNCSSGQGCRRCKLNIIFALILLTHLLLYLCQWEILQRHGCMSYRIEKKVSINESLRVVI